MDKRALKIPEKVREAVLFNEKFPALRDIPNSQAHPAMKLLFDLYQDFLVPSSKSNDAFQLSCPFCRQRVMTLFSDLWPSFVELHNAYMLMQSFKKE